MARITSAALGILLCLVQSPLASANSPLTLIDASGSLTRATIPQSTIGEGIVAVLTSPGTSSFFDGDEGVTIQSFNGASVITSPGAIMSGSSLLSKGNGAAAAASVSGSIIVSGITESDLEFGLDETRHGQTLTGIFRSKIQSTDGSKVTLIVTVPVEVDGDTIKSDVKALFEGAKAEAGSDVEFEDVYEVSVETVTSDADAERVMNIATEAASKSETKSNVSSTIAEIYSQASSSTSEATPSATAAMLACEESYSRNYKTARAKLSSWKSRTARGLTVDNFGTAASQLMKRTMELFDRDTIVATGIPGSVASYRLATRSKLLDRMEKSISELFALQVENLEKSTLKKFNAMLLRKHGKDKEGTGDFYNDNEAALRSAQFIFDTAVGDLEIPSLSLSKSKASLEMSNKLNTALLSFPDSAAAKLKDMKQVTKAVNKQKQPTQRSVDLGLDLVAMIRPDGYGNLQGFGGYQLGANNIIVGVHNDADSPDVIAQFGGKRPPFLRVQPKLKVDVEL